ncbi:radical SAM protein [Shewanella psychropiezotolerans]|uniref:radical SAM protein n=1 Tax=Shewanella psychropiezotolerans TaxID=2593655 RepID=UPI002D219D90|nr:radical SAM protein [Shewanella psychropiezotolerans]
MNDFLPISCHVMAKPSGSICNLDCTYCFYLEKEHLYPNRKLNWKMNLATVEAFIKQQIDAQHGAEVVIAWQGGEPTLLGLDFFKAAMLFVDKHAREKTVSHTMQTNGILLDNAWCSFFKKNDFLIGISIDGPEEMHDKYRLTRSGKPTHARVLEAILLLQEHQVEFNTLTVVSDFNVKSPLKLYHYLKSIGSNNIQFIPWSNAYQIKQMKMVCTLSAPSLI